MMFSRALVARIVPQVRFNHSGSGSVISGPPSNPLSTFEKMGHALFMFVATMSVPAYVLLNIRKYRGVE